MANFPSRYRFFTGQDPVSGLPLRSPASAFCKLLLASSVGLALAPHAQAVKPGHGHVNGQGVALASISSTSLIGSGRPVVEQLLQTFEQAGKGKSSRHHGSASVCASETSAEVGAGADNSGLSSELNNKAATLIDYAKMSERCLGKAPWEALSASRKRDFSATLRSLVESRYYPRWRRIFSSGKVAFLDETMQDGDIVVHTRLTLGKKEEVLSWRVTGATPRIVSLAVADKDLLDRLSSRIQARYKKVGFDALLSWMKGKWGGNEGTSIASARTGSSSGSSTGSSVAAVSSTSLSD